MSRAVRVDLGERGYDVVVGRDLLAGVAARVPLGDARRAAVVAQPTVADLYAGAVRRSFDNAGLDTDLIVVPDGEAGKDLATAAVVYRALAAMALGRGDVVVAVGGGAVGDLAGFVAATWNRGVAIVHVPTTLLAQVDAAIGGKTAVNIPEGKNLVGAFHQPAAVVADVDTLATLPPRELRSGLAEVVKCGLIADAVILDVLEADPDRAAGGDPGVLEELVARSAAVKAAVVAADEREAGERAHLNLGHTYAHALEAATGYRRWLHGEAVAVGTCAALRLGVRMGLTPPDLVGRAEALLARLGLPTTADGPPRAETWRFMARDKKARGAVRFVVLAGPAKPTVVTPDPGDVDAALDEVEQGGS